MGIVEIYEGQISLKEWNKTHDQEGHKISNEERKYYVYLYIDPNTHQIRYIGKGTRDRASVHIRRARDGNYPIENKRLTGWLRGIDCKPIVTKVATGLTEEEAFGLEATLIEAHKNCGKSTLLNKKKGGTN